jgi:hypothetical protein
MTTQIAVDRGLELIAKISELREELKTIEGLLHTAALNGDQVDLVDPDREGKQFLASGSAKTVPIILTADNIVGQFIDDSPMHVRLKEIAGDKLKEFFKKKTIWENLAKSGKQFRSLAAMILEAKAPEFISGAISRDKDGIPKSSIKIEWDRAEEIKPCTP